MTGSGLTWEVTRDSRGMFGGSVHCPEKYPNVLLIYIYARGYAGGKYLESTSDLDFLLTQVAEPGLGIYHLFSDRGTKKLYTAFNGRWMKLK